MQKTLSTANGIRTWVPCSVMGNIFRSHYFHLLDSEFGEILRRPGQDGLITAHDDRPSNEFGMLYHYANQFIIVEILIRDVLLIDGFVLPQCVLRLESGAA